MVNQLSEQRLVGHLGATFGNVALHEVDQGA